MMEKSKDRRGSSRSLLGSLLQRASSFRSLGKKSPKRSNASEFVDMDPKFTNVEFKFNQDIEKDTIIIPLNSPDDSPEELVSDSDSNITRAVVHVSYEPKQFVTETNSTKNMLDEMVIIQNKSLNESNDKVESMKTVGNKTENSYDNVCKMAYSLVKSEESSLSPRLIRSPDQVQSANSNDTSPDSEAMSTLSIAATEEEKKKLFSHPNSVEEELLPHVPTTLPLERSVGVPIVPVRHRIAETKTCSLDRPTRCSTPNSATDLPSGLGTYAIAAAFEESLPAATDKIQITLPKLKKQTTIFSQTPLSPYPSTGAGCCSKGTTDQPPARRRARSVNQESSQGCWVDFGDDGEDGRAASKPKSPKKITVLPMSMRPRRRSSSTNADHGLCGCDCHHPGTWPVTRNRSDTS